ncbi:MAG: thiamine/thiamine pyrophosphate ABC transporter permease ThiP [Rhodobacteraceae bacterium]|nr:thiamine/thiamine pyrophosphate ABC transporter permease ThiP [Paracoccaceae bacterium]
MRPAALAGGAAAVFVASITLGPLAIVALRAEIGAGLGPADLAAIRFTIWQALLSAVFSTLLAIPVARALARRRFWGRGALITLMGAPFIVPVIVAVFGILAVFGRNGIVNTAFAWLGLPPVSVYGLQGVVLAHVFFNLPLATRLILQGWLDIPSERFRLAASLNLSPRAMFRLLEWPMLREVVPGVMMLIFLICTTSFAVALTLGGGPAATTVELAIYQAFLLEFDLGRAAMLAGVQFALTGAAALVALVVAVPAAMGAGLDRRVERWDGLSLTSRLVDGIAVSLAAVFLIVPLVMIALSGAEGLTRLPPEVLGAAGRSLIVAVVAAALTLVLSVSIASAAQALKHRGGAARLIEMTGYLAIAASPLVIGTGLFLLVFPIVDPARIALVVTAVVNALMALPFALRAVMPALAAAEARYGRTADALGLRGWARMRWLILPRLRRPLGFAGGLTAALSMGDLGVVALFSPVDAATLPLQMYRLMGAFRMEDAAGAALLLLMLSLALFWVFDRGGRVNADA